MSGENLLNNHLGLDVVGLNIFIPYQFPLNSPCVVLGYCCQEQLMWQINCLFAFPVNSQKNVSYVFDQLRDRLKNYCRSISICIGFVNCQKTFSFETDDHRSRASEVFFSVKLQGGLFSIEKVYSTGNDITDRFETVTIVIYNCEEVCKSELLAHNQSKPSVDKIHFGVELPEANFLHFVRWSSFVAKSVSYNDGVTPCFEERQMEFPRILVVGLSNVIFVVLKIGILTWLLNLRVFALLKRVLLMSACIKHFVRKFKQLEKVGNNLQNRDTNVTNANMLSALIVDMLCGFLATYLFVHYIQPFDLFSWIVECTTLVVDELQKLLQWLMGAPAGLKLNRPLNNILGRFFSYHIYLFKTYIVVIKPVVAYVLEAFLSVGLLGFSFFLALACDLFTLATIHIYCFYGYAARLYALTFGGLVAFWRLFRGKKWNPLRKRVDSYEYDVQQLFIGTLSFTILMFLLPTVALYYAVFTLLHLSVLSIRIVLMCTVHATSMIPAYAVVLHLTGSHKVKGDVYFAVCSYSMNTVTLSMKVIPLPFMKTIQKTLPEGSISSSKPNWCKLLRNLLTGQIVNL